MKRTTVSLYVREPITRRYKLVPQRNKPDYPSTTTFVLRYGSTWETLKVNSLAAATDQQIQRELALLRGWRPTAKPRTESASKVKMLDVAMDEYLAEIEAGRKPKTFSAYRVSLRYFYECVGNKPLKDINRPDILDFPVFLRDEKNQGDRSTYNKFENVMTFLKHYDITGKVLKIRAHDWPKFVEEEPEIYEQELLVKFFAECDTDELLLFEFFLMTGMREQEVRR